MKIKKTILLIVGLLCSTCAAGARAELLTLQVDKDTYIDAYHPNTNFGGGWKVLISGDSGKLANGLLHFDFNLLPDVAVIENVKLTVLAHGNNLTNTFFIHPLVRIWNQSTATWFLSETGVSWTNPGGDYDQSAYASISLPGSIPAWMVIDITSIVVDEAGRPKLNITDDGLLLRADTGYSKLLSAEFATYDNAESCHSCHGTYDPELDQGKSIHCENCHSQGGIPLHGEPTLVIQYQIPDSDGDGINDDQDNCPNNPNPGQEDTLPPGGNGIGNACDCEPDFLCDGDVDGTDAAVFKIDFGRRNCTSASACNGDLECDGDVDGTNAAQFKQDFGRKQNDNPCPACTARNWCGG